MIFYRVHRPGSLERLLYTPDEIREVCRYFDRGLSGWWVEPVPVPTTSVRVRHKPEFCRFPDPCEAVAVKFNPAAVSPSEMIVVFKRGDMDSVLTFEWEPVELERDVMVKLLELRS